MFDYNEELRTVIAATPEERPNRWLKDEENESFSFYSAEQYMGVEFEVYMDDYGQSFHLAWIDPDTKEIRTWCCGSYNSYVWDMADIAEYVLAPRLNHTQRTVLKENN